MILYEDSRQKTHKHDIKHEWWEAHGVKVVRASLTAKTHAIDHGIAPAGDYCVATSRICIDTKRSVDEIAQNINGREHKRFIAEAKRAAEHGFHLIVLVENDLGYESVGDVVRWVNGHCVKCGLRARHGEEGGCRPLEPHGKCPRHRTQKPIQGARLHKAMRTIEERYGCEFMFCSPEDSARVICELLNIVYEREDRE